MIAEIVSFEDEWQLSRTEDGALIIRSLAKFREEAARAGRPILIVVNWKYGPEESGMPDAETLAAIVQFEDALYESLDDEWGVEAATVIGNGAKEWRFYTSSPETFYAGLNEALAGHPRYPLELEAFEDPNWEALVELLPDGQA